MNSNFKKETLEKYMRLVLKEATLAFNEGEVPIASLIVKDGEILSLERNRVEALQDATKHAEMLALQAASKKIRNWRLDGASLFVNVEPCTMCMGAIELARISSVIYGASEPLRGACGSRYDLSMYNLKKIKIISGILENEASELLKMAFMKKR
ncbi:MAG: nucleoside deaminase [Bdellovibrionota bacterium]